MNARLALFFVLSCILSWLCWLPIVRQIGTSPFESPPMVILLFFIGAYGPTFVGLFLSYFYDKKGGFASIKTRLSFKAINKNLLFTSAMVGPVLYVLGLILYLVFGGEVGAKNMGLLPWIPVIILVSLFLGPLAEEFGWRGFALPLLKPENNPIQASIIIGVLWAAWHIPLFWAKSGTAISGFEVTVPMVLLFFMAVIGSSFIYTWYFNRTAGSIIVAVLLHLSMNASGTIRGMFFPEMNIHQSLSFYKYYVIVVWLVVAVGFLKTKLKNN